MFCYFPQVPIDPETGQRVTGNPLMLSVVIGIFEEYERTAIEKRQSTLVMPETSIAIYEHAASAILEREGIMLAKRVSAAGNTRLTFGSRSHGPCMTCGLEKT